MAAHDHQLLSKNAANFTPLSPLHFLRRASSAYAARTSVVYGRRSFTWKQTHDRCRRLASSLLQLGLRKNDVVSVLAPNVPAMLEMHFAVPMAGAVLNPINTRLDAYNVAAIIRHAEAKLFFVDYQYVRLARDALRLLIGDRDDAPMPLVAVIDDADMPTGIRLGKLEYELMVAEGDPTAELPELTDEWDPIALNYTSGTTSAPKGVVYSHRGAYLSTLSLLLQWGVGPSPVYLWSLPMFHCNGWTFTWGVAARGGVNVCIRGSRASDIYDAITRHRVTHMCCAPVVFNILADGGNGDGNGFFLPSPVNVLVGGAPPSASLLQRAELMGFVVTHAYGMTEATGPALICEWPEEWDRLPARERAALKARQGVGVLSLADVEVFELKSKANVSVPRDGKTMGEIALRGSSIMKGYLKNEKANGEAFRAGWLMTGDVAVVHADGYVEIKDRCKDVIISGGENISPSEVESALRRHPSVADAAVVAMPHPKWGETPCAFVVRKKGAYAGAEEEDVIAHCRKSLPHFMQPSKVVFLEALPFNGNGKVEKAKLREAAKSFTVVERLSAGAPVGKKKAPATSVGVRDEQDAHMAAISRL